MFIHTHPWLKSRVKIAPLPPNEAARLAALHRYDVLDTPPEPAFDDLTRLAAQICGTPISLITLLDASRQWFMSRTGLETSEAPRDVSFCSHTILQPDLSIVEDASRDERFADNPLVSGERGTGNAECGTNPAFPWRFYAGMPLVTPDGFALGTL